jgi:hemerythrin
MNRDSFVHYKTGIEEIDSHHWELIEEMNLISSFIRTRNYNEATNLVTVLIENVKKHFKEEEKFMESFNYPYIEYHKQQHNQILSDLLKIENMLKNVHVLTWDVTRSLHDAIVDHIDKCDLQYVDFYKKSKNS